MAKGNSSDAGAAWRKRGDWLAVAAALMLGFGGGSLASAAVGNVAVSALLVGCFTLAWAAVQKQRLEMQGLAQPAQWEVALFWASWVAIAVVGAIIIWRTVSA